MSIQAMVFALEQKEVKDPTARHVLLCLANYADKEGRGAFPSTGSLSQDTGLSIRTIRYKLDDLLEVGMIRLGKQAIAAAYIDRHDRRPVVYDIAMERGAPAAPRGERGANDDATGCSSEHNGVQMTTERGAPAAANPSFNRHLSVKEQEQGASAQPASRKASKFDPLTACPANVSAAAWADWCQHRREIRKPLTAKTVEQQGKALAGHSMPDEVLRQSIANGWTGIFPDKVQAASNSTLVSRHHGFADRDYTTGLTDNGDGTYGF